jgi:hypothetical protein
VISCHGGTEPKRGTPLSGRTSEHRLRIHVLLRLRGRRGALRARRVVLITTRDNTSINRERRGEIRLLRILLINELTIGIRGHIKTSKRRILHFTLSRGNQKCPLNRSGRGRLGHTLRDWHLPNNIKRIRGKMSDLLQTLIPADNPLRTSVWARNLRREWILTTPL